ncbi:m7GpppX diphosphatase [Octopus vulgaris]|uniref:M7GpppX diphosphatase n=2 Tax=Octopus TaxID=6643 RepID=A0AA36BAN6_OCTVU|nr:m7GpppX diphosphatase [Octopus sinensis]CAI9730182.1 m7GpppX diphosphatase [Octopus vulgaris]
MAESGEPASKKQKVEEFNKVKKDLSNFQVIKVLREDAAKKLLVVEGRIQDSSDETSNENKAVLFLERNPINIEYAKELVLSDHMDVSFRNDCYYSLLLAPSKPSYDVKATFINPATDLHITKYTQQECFVVHETPEIYQKIALPALEKEALCIDWVYNILNKKSEKERILYEDPDPEKGFILLPDLKWNGTDIDSLYFVAIVHKRNIKSIRDLNQSHLPMLKSILTECPIIIEKKYGVPAYKLYMYCHYKPSYPHFHVHINNIKLDCPGKTVHAAHLLSDIIQNIQLKSTYYLDRTITYQVKQKTLLYEQLKSAGHIGQDENNPCEVKDLVEESQK